MRWLWCGVCLCMLLMTGCSVARPTSSVASSGTATSEVDQEITTRDTNPYQGTTQGTSTNWAGYVTTGSTYSQVQGTWVQPSVTCAAGETTYSAFWVGLDGDGSKTVEQLGTDANCTNGVASYSAWWEVYPRRAIRLPSTYVVQPGDQITASVVVASSQTIVLTMTNARAGWKFSTTRPNLRFQFASAEWIAESPSVSGELATLADFGNVTFTQATANGKALTANPNLTALTMATNGVVRAQPSGLTADGTTFSVTWQHA